MWPSELKKERKQQAKWFWWQCSWIRSCYFLGHWFCVWLSFSLSPNHNNLFIATPPLPSLKPPLFLYNTMHYLLFHSLLTTHNKYTLHSPSITTPPKAMLDQEHGSPWSELKLPEVLFRDTIKELHMKIESEWDPLQQSACQTAAGRALWKHVTHDMFADVLAGETYLRSFYEKIKKDRSSNAREVSGVILAVRSLWFDSKLEAAISNFGGGASQVVVVGAGMDTRAYRLCCLRETDVFEVDFDDVLQVKAALIEAAAESPDKEKQLMVKAKSLTRVAADIREETWLEKLQVLGYIPERNTVWVLEGILYYLSDSQAMQVLKTIADKCGHTSTVLLADFMNKPTTTISSSTYQFYSDWPDHLLPSLGFSNVKLSQIGDPDADFGLMKDPLNLFNKLRSLPRSMQIHPEDGTPCRRLYLVLASGSPNNIIS